MNKKTIKSNNHHNKKIIKTYKKSTTNFKHNVSKFYSPLSNEHNITCISDIHNIINTFLEKGWKDITDKYNMSSNKDSKYSDLDQIPDIDDLLLTFLGHLRTYIVNKMYQCYALYYYKNDNFIKLLAPGSTNITSDYDVTLIGKYSPEIMLNMFFDFLYKYKHTLPYSLDTNLYIGGLLTYNKSYKYNGVTNIEIEGYNDEMSLYTYEPNNKNESIKSIMLAMLKIYEFKIMDNIKPNSDSSFTKMYKKYKNILGHMSDRVIKLSNGGVISNNRVLSEHLDVMVDSLNSATENKSDINRMLYRHILQYYYIKNIYSRTDINILDYLNFGKIFSIEAYYTQCSFNVVVLMIQDKRKLKLLEINYICCLLENCADFYDHTIHYGNNLTEQHKLKILVKYNKYINRMLFCLLNIRSIKDVTKYNLLLKNLSLNMNKSDLYHKLKVLGYSKIRESDNIVANMLEYRKKMDKLNDDNFNEIKEYFRLILNYDITNISLKSIVSDIIKLFIDLIDFSNYIDDTITKDIFDDVLDIDERVINEIFNDELIKKKLKI